MNLAKHARLTATVCSVLPLDVITYPSTDTLKHHLKLSKFSHHLSTPTSAATWRLPTLLILCALKLIVCIIVKLMMIFDAPCIAYERTVAKRCYVTLL